MKKISLILSLISVLLLVGCTDNKPLVRLSTPKNLVFSEDTLTFDAVDHATSYLILADDFSVTTQTNSYTFTGAGTYRVRVIAKADGYLDSLFSSQIEVVIQTDPGDPTPTRLDAPTNLEFSENTLTFDAVEHATNYKIIGDNIDVVVTTNHYTFTTDGVHRVSIIAQASGYKDSLFSEEIEVIVVFEDSKPFVISTNGLTTNFESDIIITFESVGFTFKGLNGYEVTQSNYTYQNDVLTIDIEYIESVFDNNPERDSLIFSYTFEKETQTHLGFITIKK